MYANKLSTRIALIVRDSSDASPSTTFHSIHFGCCFSHKVFNFFYHLLVALKFDYECAAYVSKRLSASTQNQQLRSLTSVYLFTVCEAVADEHSDWISLVERVKTRNRKSRNREALMLCTSTELSSCPAILPLYSPFPAIAEFQSCQNTTNISSSHQGQQLRFSEPRVHCFPVSSHPHLRFLIISAHPLTLHRQIA